MLLSELVLVGSLRPTSILIQLVTMSRHSHLLFRTNDGRVIDSTFKHGGVTIHDWEGKFPFQWERRLILAEHFTAQEIEEMTRRAESKIGVKYDQRGVLHSYIPNRPRTDWQKRLWCFEFGRVVMNGLMSFDHRPDRAVGRHWLRTMKRGCDGTCAWC